MTFFTPTGPCFTWFPPDVWPFSWSWSGAPWLFPWSRGVPVCSFYVFVCVAVAGFVCVRVFLVRKAFMVLVVPYGVVVCLVIAGFVSYCIVCARSGRTLGARSDRDNNRITLILILWKSTI